MCRGVPLVGGFCVGTQAASTPLAAPVSEFVGPFPSCCCVQVNQGYISFVEEEGLGKESVEGGLTQEDSTTRGSKGASAAGSAVRVATPQSLSVSLLSSHRHDQDLVFDQLLD